MRKCLFIILLILLSLNFVFGVNLTEKEKLEDFEFLYSTLKQNFPYFNVLQREEGFKWLNKKKEYIKKIKETKIDIEYFNVLNVILKELNNGHTDLTPTLYRDYFLKSYKEAKMTPWVNEIENGSDYWKKLLESKSKISFNEDYDESNINFWDLENDKIAVIKIKSFNHFQIDKDMIKIESFLKKVKNTI